MAAETGVPIEEVVKGGPGLAFIVYPKAITLMPAARFWGIMFFIMILLLCIDSLFCGLEGHVTSVCDVFLPDIKQEENRTFGPREKIVLLNCCLCFLVGITMVMKNGIFMFTIFDFYSASGIVLLIVASFECLAIGWFYGGEKFSDDLNGIMEYTPFGSQFMVFAWKYASPTYFA